MSYRTELTLASVLTLTLLTGCATSSVGTRPLTHYPLARVPNDVRTCFTKLVPAPEAGAMSSSDVVALVARLRQSEVSKTRCGKRLLALYDKQSAAAKGR